jgi:hypothetical protein
MKATHMLIAGSIVFATAGAAFAQPSNHTIMGMQYRGVSPSQQARLECGTFTVPPQGGTITSAGSSNAGFWIARAPDPTNVVFNFDTDAAALNFDLPAGTYMVCPNLPPNVGEWRVQIDVFW